MSFVNIVDLSSSDSDSSSENSVKTPNYNPDTHSKTAGSESVKSPSYHPMTKSEWEALQDQKEESEPSEHFSESSVNKPSSKRKQQEIPTTNEAGPSKKTRSSSASCDNCSAMKAELLKLREHVEKHCKTITKHEMRLDGMDADYEVMEDNLRSTFACQARKLEKLVKVNFDRLRGRMENLDKCNGYRFNVNEDRMEKHYQNMEYFWEKLEVEKYERQKFEKYVSAYLWDEKKKPDSK